MDHARLVGLHNILREQDAAGDVLGNLACHIIPLDGIDGGVLVGIFLLDLLVVALDEAEDLIIRGVGFAHQVPGITVGDVFFGHLKGAVRHDLLFHQILDLFHAGGTVGFPARQLHTLGDPPDLHGRHAFRFGNDVIGFGHSLDDLRDVEHGFRAVALDDLHRILLSFVRTPGSRPVIATLSGRSIISKNRRKSMYIVRDNANLAK